MQGVILLRRICGLKQINNFHPDTLDTASLVLTAFYSILKAHLAASAIGHVESERTYFSLVTLNDQTNLAGKYRGTF